MNFSKKSTSFKHLEDYFKSVLGYLHGRGFSHGQANMFNVRRWVNVLNPKKANLSANNVKIMSYNVLSQTQLEKHFYLYKDNHPDDLDWNQRWLLLLFDFKYHDSDIICLQEVDEISLSSHFDTELNKMGYVGLFKKRLSYFPDGCAIYFKANKFTLQEFETVEYYQPESELLDRNNVGIIAKLSLKSDETISFVVATTHLLYNPRRNDVRLAQMMLLLAEIDRFAYVKTDNTGVDQHLPIIITGDFNNPPESPVYQFMINKELMYEDLLKKSMDRIPNADPSLCFGKQFLPIFLGVTDNCQHFGLKIKRQKSSKMISKDRQMKLLRIRHSDRNVSFEKISEFNNDTIIQQEFSTGILRHPFNFRSVEFANWGATTYHDNWTLVDFIFYSGAENGLKLQSYYSLPDINFLENNNIVLPNQYCGSDHLPVLANFLFDKNNSVIR